MDLAGKVAFVSGGGKRLGRALAVTLAEGGADIVLHVNRSSGKDVAEEIRDLGRRVVVVRADLARLDETQRLAQQVLAAVGKIDVLVNNAAVFGRAELPQVTAQMWRTVVRTNLTGAFLLSWMVGREMKRQGSGKIVQVGDWTGTHPVAGYVPYCVTKAGILALTGAFAKALAPEVQVNAIAPGPVLPPTHYDTATRHSLIEGTPLRRLGEAHDVARTVRFLVEKGGGITGATYYIDGGWSATAGGRGISL
jgi:pteridine reductase